MEKKSAGKAAFAAAAALIVALGLAACGPQAASSAGSSGAGGASASASSASASSAASSTSSASTSSSSASASSSAASSASSSASGGASSAGAASEGYGFAYAYKGTGSDGKVYYYATDETAENTAIVIYDAATKTGVSYIGPFTMETDNVHISVTDRDSGEKVVFEATTDGQGHQLYKFDNGQDVIMDACPADEVAEVVASLG